MTAMEWIRSGAPVPCVWSEQLQRFEIYPGEFADAVRLDIELWGEGGQS